MCRIVNLFPDDIKSSVCRKFGYLDAKMTDVSVSVQIESEDVWDQILWKTEE